MTASPPDETDRPDTDQPGTTGHARVDGVLASLAGVEDRPLADHLDVLVAAHEQLHTTLDEFRSPEGGDDDAPAGSEHP